MCVSAGCPSCARTRPRRPPHRRAAVRRRSSAPSCRSWPHREGRPVPA
ncbi:uncharacterized protein ACA1_354810, partial [Acanthamoeba castellanii str. Neff]